MQSRCKGGGAPLPSIYIIAISSCPLFNSLPDPEIILTATQDEMGLNCKKKSILKMLKMS